MSRENTKRAVRSAVLQIALMAMTSTAGCRMGMHAERHASATLFDASGREVGVVALTEDGSSVEVSGSFQSLAVGQHGIHFHSVGRCDAAGAFASAGAHLNPAARSHGLENPAGPHAGDLPNLVIDSTGHGRYRTSTSRVTLGAGSASLLDADGSAVVVHAMVDDQRTDPAGNSGARVACGLVRAR